MRVRRAVAVGAVAIALAVVGAVVWSRIQPATTASQPESAARAKLRAWHDRPGATISGRIEAGDSSALVCARRASETPRCIPADQSYQFVDLAPGRWAVWASSATASATAKTVELVPGGHATVDLVLVHRGRRLAGVVRDVRGRPLAGATIHVVHGAESAPEHSTRSGSDGRFVAYSDQPTATVIADADGFVAGELSTRVPADDLAFGLLPEATVTGTVVTADDHRPVAGATVRLDNGVTAESDEGGHFRLTKITPHRYKVVATAIGLYGETTTVLIGLGAAIGDLVIEMHPVATVAARIMTPAGGCRPDHTSAGLMLRGGDNFSIGIAVGDGEVVFEGLLPGAYRVDVHCEGYLAAASYPDVVVGDSDVEGVMWTVGEAARLTGVVTDLRGAPIEGAQVRVNDRANLRAAAASTAPDGRFEVREVVPGAGTLTASAVGYRAVEREVVTALNARGEPIAIALAPAAQLVVRVIDGAGAPVRDAEVIVDGELDRRAAGVDDRGYSEFYLEPGSYRVSARPHRMLDGLDAQWPSSEVAVAADARRELAITVAAPARTALTGVVVDASGASVSDAWVQIARADNKPTYGWTGERLVGPDGSFQFTDLPLDTAFAVRAYYRGGREAIVGDAAPGGALRIALPAAATIAGIVSDASGRPHSDITVEVHDFAARYSRSERLFRTGGRFVFTELPPGTYQVKPVGEPSGAVTVTVAANQRRDVSLVAAQRYAVRGRLIHSDRTPCAGYAVEVEQLTEVRPTAEGTIRISDNELTESAVDGSFVVHHVAGDSVTVSAGISAGSTTRLLTVPLRGASSVIDVGDVIVP